MFLGLSFNGMLKLAGVSIDFLVTALVTEYNLIFPFI